MTRRSGAIHRASGPELERECKPLAPIKPGEAVITSGQRMPNEYIIPCLGPVYGKGQPEEELLARRDRSSLGLAEEKGLKSVGFPAISTAAFGYPMENAASVAFEPIQTEAPKLESVTLVRFVLFSGSDLEVHEKVLKGLE